jgi:hypothetical protein
VIYVYLVLALGVGILAGWWMTLREAVKWKVKYEECEKERAFLEEQIDWQLWLPWYER